MPTREINQHRSKEGPVADAKRFIASANYRGQTGEMAFNAERRGIYPRTIFIGLQRRLEYPKVSPITCTQSGGLVSKRWSKSRNAS